MYLLCMFVFPNTQYLMEVQRTTGFEWLPGLSTVVGVRITVARLFKATLRRQNDYTGSSQGKWKVDYYCNSSLIIY